MKTKLFTLALIAISFVGCAWERSSTTDKSGIVRRHSSITPITPPVDSIVRVEVSSIGIVAGQNQVTQSPEATIGYKRATYTRIPTGTNKVYSADVRASIGVDGGLKVGIAENLETGAAVESNTKDKATSILDKAVNAK